MTIDPAKPGVWEIGQDAKTRDDLLRVDIAFRRAHLVKIGAIVPKRWSPDGPTWWPRIDKPTFRLAVNDPSTH